MNEQEDIFNAPEPEQKPDGAPYKYFMSGDALSDNVIQQMFEWLHRMNGDFSSVTGESDAKPDWTYLPTPPEEERFLLPGLPGLFKISFETGTGTTFTGANGMQYHFQLSGSSTDNVRINFPDIPHVPSQEETARLADEILRSLDNLNNPMSAAQTHEMLSAPPNPAPKARQNTSKPVQNAPEKPVRWKKSEKNRLKFYKWLVEQGVFDADIHPTQTEMLSDLLRDVAEADTYVPPVPRLSDH